MNAVPQSLLQLVSLLLNVSMEARESKISEACLSIAQLVRLVTYTERELTDGRGGIVKTRFLWSSGLCCSYSPIWLTNTITKLMESYYVLTDGYKLFKIAIITFNDCIFTGFKNNALLCTYFKPGCTLVSLRSKRKEGRIEKSEWEGRGIGRREECGSFFSALAFRARPFPSHLLHRIYSGQSIFRSRQCIMKACVPV